MERRTVRVIVLTAFALWALGWVAFLIVSPAPAGAISGWNLSNDGTPTISFVTPDGGASLAGIRTGGMLAWRVLPVFGRANLDVELAAPLGSKLRATVIHGNREPK